MLLNDSLGTLCSCLTRAGEGLGIAPCLVSVFAHPAGSEPLLTEVLCPEWLCGWLLCSSQAERFPSESGVENKHMHKLKIRNNKLKIAFSSDKIISLFSCLSAEKGTFNKQTPGSNLCHSATYHGTDPEDFSSGKAIHWCCCHIRGGFGIVMDLLNYQLPKITACRNWSSINSN